MVFLSFRCLVANVLTTSVISASAISLNQIDDFEDATTLNWSVSGRGAPNRNTPANVSTGGPNGAEDNYLLLNSRGGSGPSSWLTAFDFFGQWSGDYVAAGVNLITTDARNFGSNDLYLRLMVASVDGGGNVTNGAISESVFLPTESDWRSVSFSLDPVDLFAGIGNVTDALTNATFLRVFDSRSGNFPGTAQVASLSLDNISALAAPVLLLSAYAPLFRKRRHVDQAAT